MKGKGWVFTYIGANQNVEKVAATISITNTLNFAATDKGTSAMFMTERKSRARWFDRLSTGASNDELANDYFAEE